MRRTPGESRCSRCPDRGLRGTGLDGNAYTGTENARFPPPPERSAGAVSAVHGNAPDGQSWIEALCAPSPSPSTASLVPALSWGLGRDDRSSSRASASLIAHTVASTVA